jgi:nitrogen fixation NifU-like protein
MTELNELYQQVILDHNRAPRNYRKLDSANRKSEGFNPLCGDRIVIYLRMEGDLIQEIAFDGSGCAISKASASMMTESVKGKSKAEVQEIFNRVRTMLTTAPDEPIDATDLGKLAAFSGVREFPVRVKCATLAWHTLHAALHGQDQPVSTE